MTSCRHFPISPLRTSIKVSLATLVVIFCTLAVLPYEPIIARDTDPPPVGIERRIPLTSSRVIGSPEPPPPYRVAKAFPNLKINYPVTFSHMPGADLFLFTTETSPYSPTVLQRMKDDPKTDNFETLMPSEDVIYDITFHPNFTKNGYLYLGSNGKTADGGMATRITRYHMDPKPPYTFDPKSAKVIIEWPSNGHNGGAIGFGLDGMLYVTSGDGTSDSDGNIVGQDLSKLTSKVLRIDVDHPDEGKTYSVPKDNPFVGQKDVRPETWAYGLRNPWRLTVDSKTGQIWVGNNGQDLWEQAYLIRKGENYGWSVVEGSHPFYPSRKTGPTPISKPTVEHSHSEFRSLTGGIVYHGKKFPELDGAYIYGDYSTGKIWGIRHDGDKVIWHKELADSRLQITCFATDAQGELLIADHRGDGKGNFYTLESTPKDLPPSTFPLTLGESGLFTSVKGHAVQPGVIPYSVNAPFWSDGAFKVRYMALPGADSQIGFTTQRGWNFPDRTVLVKSFALELEEGNPKTQTWIETRFLTKQEGEWFGYSYRWNDEQTDGRLVAGKGDDREFSIRVPKSADYPEGIRKQVWHYPSRSECMVCHSRASNFVLGTCTLQMNMEHDYGTVRANQLRTLDYLGIINWGSESRAIFQEEAKAKGLKDKQIEAYVNEQLEAAKQAGGNIGPRLVKAIENSPHLVDPYDAKLDITARARSFLHANCAQCHVKEGGGNAQIDLEMLTPLENMKVMNVKPQHHSFDLKEAGLIVPGHPERSALLHRVSQRQAGFMPPLATSRIDEEAVKLLRAWIEQMPVEKGIPTKR